MIGSSQRESLGLFALCMMVVVLIRIQPAVFNCKPVPYLGLLPCRALPELRDNYYITISVSMLDRTTSFFPFFKKYPFMKFCCFGTE